MKTIKYRVTFLAYIQNYGYEEHRTTFFAEDFHAAYAQTMRDKVMLDLPQNPSMVLSIVEIARRAPNSEVQAVPCPCGS